MAKSQTTHSLAIYIALLILISVSAQNITTTINSNPCSFVSMNLQSSSVLPFSIIEHLSQDKNSAYETELDGDDNYLLYGYKNQFQVGSTVTTDVTQFNIPIDILFQIAYISSKGGCVIVDNSTQLIAFQTSTLNFVQVQRINYTSYTSLRASESCNIIQIIDGTNPLSIYINSNVYSGANTPTANTLFDNTFTFGLDDSNNLYQFASDSFTIIKTFDSTVNLDTPLNVIDKPDSSFVILYSTNLDGDYALVIYDYSEDSILVQQKWTAAQLTGNKVLKVQNGDRFISLMFKDDTGIIYMVTWANNMMNVLTPYSATQKAMFSGNAIISFNQEEVYSYLNNMVNVFDIYLPDELFYLGSFNQVDIIQMASTVNPTGSAKNYIKYLTAIGIQMCEGGVQNSTQNETAQNETQNETAQNETQNQTNAQNETQNQTNAQNETQNETAQNETQNETNAQNETQNQTNAQNETQNETAQNQTQNQTNAQNETQNQTNAQNETQNETAQNETQNETNAQNETQNQTNAQNETQNETAQNETQNETNAQNETQNQTNAQNETQNETAQNETQNETNAQNETQNQTNAQNETQNETNAQNETQNQTNAQNETQNETAQNETQNETNAQNETQNQTNAQNETQNETAQNETQNETNAQNETQNETSQNETQNETSQNQTQNQTQSNQTFDNTTEIDIQVIIQDYDQNGDEGFQFQDSQGNVLNCPTACMKCTDGSTCTKCNLGYVKNNNFCMPCKGCMQCQPNNRQHCLSCFQPAVLNQNTNKCQIKVCSNPLCQTCDDQGKCTTCFDQYSIWNGNCLKCVDDCGVCTESQSGCDADSCNQGFIFSQNSITNQSQCVACTAGCLSCEPTNLDNCISCVPGYYSSLDNTKVPPSDTCLECISNCDVCSDSISCTTCSAGYKVASSGLKCVLKCSSSCLTCQENLPDNCLTCTGDYTYNPTAKTCQASIACNNLANCKSCPSGYVLDNKICHPCSVSDLNCKHCLNYDRTVCGTCKSTYYLDTIDNSCKSCSTKCAKCFDENSCFKCESGSYLIKQYKKFFGYCEACQSPCLTCYKKKSICTSCIQGYTKKGKKCKSSKNNEVLSEVDIPFNLFILIQKALHRLMRDTCSKFEKTGDKDIIFHKMRRGSTIVGATISASSPTAVNNMNAGLKSALAAGNTVLGYPFISSTVTANGIPDSSSNLGLILGVSIPLFILFVLIVGYAIYKKNQGFQKGKDYSKESQNNIRQNQDTFTQKI